MNWRHRVYPSTQAGFLASRFRRFIHPPERIIRRYIHRGETVLDLGCGPGYFTIPMAKMVGERGTVIAVDIQDEMLELTRKAAEKEGVLPRTRLHKGSGNSLGLDLPPVVSFALAFHVLHETTDQRAILGDLYRVICPGGLLLVAEPRGIVGAGEFHNTVGTAIQAGFAEIARPCILLSRPVLLKKGNAQPDHDNNHLSKRYKVEAET